jgi:hypothetical protein
MFKKIALLVLFVGVTVGVALLLYRFFFAVAPTTTPPPTGTTTVPGGLPTAGTGRPTGTTPPGVTNLPPAAQLPVVASGGPTATPQVAPDLVLQPMASPSGLNYYDTADGHFYRVTADGKAQALSSQAFPAVRDVTWAPSGDKAVITFPDESKVVYNFDTQQQVTIPSHWQDPQFNGDGSAIIAKSEALDPDNRWLVAMASDGSGTKLLEPLGENGDKVTISVSPDNAIVAFSDTGDPVGFDTRDLLPIGQNGENYKALRVEGFGFTPRWSPDDTHLLYSTASQKDSYEPSLWFVTGNGDGIGSGRVDLGVHTWADKCTFADASTVFCAVPDQLPEGAGLQRDIASTIPDHIERIDLKSGTTRLIGRPENDTSIDTLTVSPDGSSLYFTDSVGALRQMRLQ